MLNQELQIKFLFQYVISNSFNFYWIFKGCFDQYDWSFGDARKIDYPRSALNKYILNKGYDKKFSNTISIIL